MATTTTNMSLSFKLTLIVSAAAASVLLLSLFLPQYLLTFDAIVSSLRSSLSPPYLYLIINAIIITIAASSRLKLHHHHQTPDSAAKSPPAIYDHLDHDHGLMPAVDFTDKADPLLMYHDDNIDHDQGRLLHHPATDVDFAAEATTVYEDDLDDLNRVVDQDVYYGGAGDVEVVDETPARISGGEEEDVGPVAAEEEVEEEVTAMVEKLERWSPPAAEKPSVNSRFGHQRRPIRAAPEGVKALRVSRPRSQETLETTWKTITEGRHMPLTRHLKKSDTWEMHNRQIITDPNPSTARKSKTFKDRTGGNSNRLRKEPSVGQDELNRRVEAFINKFNEDMRLQRQQSLQQYMEMINRAV